MKKFFAALALVAFVAAPAAAEDGQVSATALKALGFSSSQVATDAEGMQVRGMSSLAVSGGLSTVSGVLLDPQTGANIVGTDANFALGGAFNAGPNIGSVATHAQGSGVAGFLNVNTAVSSYAGSFQIVTGGYGYAFAQ